ncbi:hypothetical protein NDU88_007449 [Pleurodeles waltl]|uniref:Uncharacterized protein n=1 Tax=Pleurodeles waltl TaxID=8319 RepID=A0AAV7RSZ5_PLEWA|nr:hypothetical protein NDU88_007449 [Pleurodeles waltl]
MSILASSSLDSWLILSKSLRKMKGCVCNPPSSAAPTHSRGCIALSGEIRQAIRLSGSTVRRWAPLAIRTQNGGRRVIVAVLAVLSAWDDVVLSLIGGRSEADQGTAGAAQLGAAGEVAGRCA